MGKSEGSGLQAADDEKTRLIRLYEYGIFRCWGAIKGGGSSLDITRRGFVRSSAG
jgi:hypothetical protein